MKASSAKEKGRRLQKWVRDQILARFPQLGEDDVISRGMGGGGEDVILSTAARELVPISSECKNQESLSIWAALKQTEKNAGEYTPVVFFTRNHTPKYAALPAEDLLDLYKQIADLRLLTELDSDQMDEMAALVARYIEGE